MDLAAAGRGGVSAIRALFEGAVAIAQEASVALYSLGSSQILDRATNEIMTRLAEWNLLGLDLTVLDIGCGIGRIELALAPLVDHCHRYLPLYDRRGATAVSRPGKRNIPPA